MSKIKITSAPWKMWDHPDLSDSITIIGNDGTYISQLKKNFPLHKHVEETTANAKLIAAAPELLECLLSIRMSMGEDGYLEIGNGDPEFLKLEAAIKKATE